ncbi:extracellular solute-binding protein [Paenibacillus cymbidii]|uniref:extracellular solute-binding protein n=1 Tax=Paenibacillus cymbidii TaxID=1639034 RepID=UPI001080253A|nr:extracellular solute-binding protein [Paenibacillus cymbidii]
MRTKRNTIAAVSLAASMLLVSACSSGSSGTEKTGATSQPSPSGSSAASQSPAASAKPSVDMSKKYSIEYARLLNSVNATDKKLIDENPIRTQLEKDLNIAFKLTTTPGQMPDYTQKLNTRIAAGDLPDIVRVGRDDLVKYMQNGTIIPLDELLNQVPELKKSRTADEWALDKINGNIYGVPLLQQGGAATAHYIRKDWLDKLNLKMPTTTDELYQVLVAFTNNDPDGNGKNDTFGYSSGGLNTTMQGMFANAFGMPQIGAIKSGMPEDWIDSKGELHFGAISDEFKNYLLYLNKLTAAKAVDPDILTNTNPIFQKKMVAGQFGVAAIANPQNWMIGGTPKLLQQIKEANPKAEWVYLPPVKGPTGLFGNDADASSSSLNVAITKNALKDPGLASRIIQLIDYTDTRPNPKLGGKMITYGIEGTHYNAANGKITLLPAFAGDSAAYFSSLQMAGIKPDMDFYKNTFTDQDLAAMKQVYADNSKGNVIADNYYNELPFVFDGETYIQEMELKFIYGKIGFDQWDTYVNTLKTTYKYNQVMEQRKKDLQAVGLLK